MVFNHPSFFIFNRKTIFVGIVGFVVFYFSLPLITNLCIIGLDPDTCLFLNRLKIHNIIEDDIWNDGGGVGDWSP